MKIQYASDLHLEFAENWRYLRDNPLKPVGDILILAGDIGYLGDDNYIKHPFWDWASENYKQVIVCMGNHEFYKYYDIGTIPDGYCIEIRHNIHSYYNAVVKMENATIIISTLWSYIPLKEAYYTERAVTDFKRILYNGEILTFADFNQEHKRCFNFINEAVKQNKNTIVVTHHVPSFEMLCPKFEGSLINGAFTVELGDFIKSSDINYWIYGHSHYNIDVKIGKTNCISNQLGYVFNEENKTFNSEKFIII